MSAIVITGMGSISALGGSPQKVWDAYCRSSSSITLRELYGKKFPVASLPEEEELRIQQIRNERTSYGKLDKTVLLGMLAARDAVRQAKWEQEENTGVNIGSSRGATHLFEKYYRDFSNAPDKKLNPLTSPTTTLGNIASWLAYDQNFTGFNLSHSITCSTSLHALLNACAWLQSGMTEKFLAGGAEAPLTDFTLAQMNALGIYSNKANNPFPCKPLERSMDQNSMILGEGGAIFCLEKDRGQKALVRILGLGYATEITEHNTSLSAEADCLQKSMNMALEDAKLDWIDAIVVHAPGTLRGDQGELNAIKKVFGRPIPNLISTKFLSGHSLGASGGLSLELAILMLKHQRWIDFPYEPAIENTNRFLRNIMVNVVGFGGNAVSIIISKI